MKTFLLLACTSIIIAGLLPGLAGKITLSACVSFGALSYAAGRAPVGREDARGFQSLPSEV